MPMSSCLPKLIGFQIIFLENGLVKKILLKSPLAIKFLIIDIIDFMFNSDDPDGGKCGWHWILWQKGRVQVITP